MIIILSTKGDDTTIEVSKWLKSFDCPHKIIFDVDFISNCEIVDYSVDEIIKYIEIQFECALEEVDVIWCRKWHLYKLNRLKKVIDVDAFDFNSIHTLSLSISKEIKEISDLLLDFLPKEKMINDFNSKKTSKLKQLISAQNCGLNIPETHIVKSKNSINQLKEPSSYITKPMKEGVSINYDNESYTTFTARVKFENNELEDEFVPSLVQKEIKKDFEIRSFVLGEEIFSMAIFSQGNSKTEVDFRQYDAINPNRVSRYELPEDISIKVKMLCKTLGLKTGSVDMIVDKQNKFYFLEINPFGQFGMVSKPNNYNLEYEFAKYLKSYA